MNRSSAFSFSLLRVLAAAVIALASAGALAQDVLIRNARVHTVAAAGTLASHDVLVRNGKIAAIGRGLSAGDGVGVVEANGRPLTPALFGGITGIGLDEVTQEASTNDGHLALGAGAGDMAVRPEFDVVRAFNPESILIPVARVEGIGFTLLGADSRAGGSLIGGQGGIVRLDGSVDAIGGRVLFVSLGSRAANLSGQSRAGQWLLLEQWLDEVRGKIAPDSQFAQLTPAGRAALKRYFDGNGLIVVKADRASDLRQVLRWAAQQRLNIAIAGGAEAWKLAPELAAARVAVFVDPLVNLPDNFDQLGATLENAARLHAAGVRVGISQAGDASHHARKVRQLAGNAVANGLPWDAGLAALTRIPAQTFGVADEVGTIEVGKRADLVLWSGDPLDVIHLADQVWLGGRAQPMRSRQSQLRDRYLHPQPERAAGGLPPAYSPLR